MTDSNPPLSISVVIPTYDEPGRLRAALQSLSAQEYPGRAVQVVVVDDASPQPLSEPLKDLVQPFTLVLIRNPTNQGRARARNTGLRAASGDLVVFLDSDMTVEPGFLRAHAARNPERAARVTIGNIRFAPQIPVSGLTRYIDRRGVHRLSPGDPVPFNCFVTGNSSMPRFLLDEIGLFDEDFTAYGGEDLELGYRLHRHGATFCYAPDALSWHHHLRSLDQLCQLMHTYGRQSLPLLMRKHPELARLLRLNFLERSFFSPRGFLLRLALTRAVHRPIRILTRANLENWVPDLFFDYLLWSSRTRGYLEAANARGGTDGSRHR